jgi:hypothetical protein
MLYRSRARGPGDRAALAVRDHEDRSGQAELVEDVKEDEMRAFFFLVGNGGVEQMPQDPTGARSTPHPLFFRPPSR